MSLVYEPQVSGQAVILTLNVSAGFGPSGTHRSISNRDRCYITAFGDSQKLSGTLKVTGAIGRTVSTPIFYSLAALIPHRGIQYVNLSIGSPVCRVSRLCLPPLRRPTLRELRRLPT